MCEHLETLANKLRRLVEEDGDVAFADVEELSLPPATDQLVLHGRLERRIGIVGIRAGAPLRITELEIDGPQSQVPRGAVLDRTQRWVDGTGGRPGRSGRGDV